MRGGIGPGGHRFRPRLVGVVDVWNDFVSGNDVLSAPGGDVSTNPRLELSKKAVGLRFPHRAGRYRSGGTQPVFVFRLLEVYMYGGVSDPGMTSYPPRVALDIRSPRWGLARSQWGWGFHPVIGGIYQGGHSFRPWFAEDVDVWMDF